MNFSSPSCIGRESADNLAAILRTDRRDGGSHVTFAMIVDKLRRQYRLGSYPADGVEDARLHETEVRIARRNLSIRARGSFRILSPKD